MTSGTSLCGSISWECIGQPQDFRTLSSSKELILLNQTHSADIVTVFDDRVSHESADGFFIKKELAAQYPKVRWGIRTADCLPIFLETEKSFFLLHGGWRGVAGGIVQKAASLIPEAEKIVQVVIGPAASQANYEVGSEVVAALAPFAVTREQKPSSVTSDSVVEMKYLLDLPATAIAILHSMQVMAENPAIFIHPACTIASKGQWHSYRRDGNNRGSNLLSAGAFGSQTSLL